VRAKNQALERDTVKAPSVDDAVARAEAQLARLADGSGPDMAEPASAAAEPHVWQLGEQARSRSGGWEGRIAAPEKGGTRATLESGEMRISVATDDLDPVAAPPAPIDHDRTIGGNARITPARVPSGRTSPRLADPGSRPADRSGGGVGIGTIGLERARGVASSLDLRGARVEEALEALDRYLDDAGLAGLQQVVVIHGLGTGALRDAVRTRAGSHPLVASLRAGERGEGGDGATIIKL
jgi:dsDNA-specific endonuclease/ATPase MutS2